MDIRINHLNLADLDEVMAIESMAFGNHCWSRQSFVNELNNPGGYYFAARHPQSKVLIGYSGFWLICEEAHITTLAVHPDHRYKYIGERLLLQDIAYAAKVGAQWMTLEVRASNEGAQQLYYKYGFKNLGRRQNYYQDNNEDALVLWTDNIMQSEFQELIECRTKELTRKLLAKTVTTVSGGINDHFSSREA